MQLRYAAVGVIQSEIFVFLFPELMKGQKLHPSHAQRLEQFAKRLRVLGFIVICGNDRDSHAAGFSRTREPSYVAQDRRVGNARSRDVLRLVLVFAVDKDEIRQIAQRGEISLRNATRRFQRYVYFFFAQRRTQFFGKPQL